MALGLPGWRNIERYGMGEIGSALLNRTDNGRKMFRVPEVVVREIGDQLRPRNRDAGILRKRFAPAILRQIQPANPRVAERTDQAFGVIATAIAGYDELEIAKRLPEHSLDRVTKHGTAVVGRNDNRYFWRPRTGPVAHGTS